MITINDADSMCQRHVAVFEQAIDLFTPKAGWAWITVIAENTDSLQLLVSGTVCTRLRKAHRKDNKVATWVFHVSSEGPVSLGGLQSDMHLNCHMGTLPEPLGKIFARAKRKQRSAIGQILGTFCQNPPALEAPYRIFSDVQSFDILHCCATLARRLGLFEIEIVALENALNIKASPNLKRLLSYAYANAQNYRCAAIAAERAIEANPQIVNGSFQSHLAELRAYADLGKELMQLAKLERRPAEAVQNIAYCLHSAPPYREGGYAMRSHALARAIIDEGRNLAAFARPGFPSDGASPAECPAGLRSVDGIHYHFENGFGRRGRAYSYIAEAADYFYHMFKTHDIGIVHAATNFWTALPAAIAAHRIGLPFIYEVRSFWAITREARTPGFTKTAQGRRDEELEDIVLALADEVISLNTEMCNRVREKVGDPDRITVVPNSVDINKFVPETASPSLARQHGITKRDVVIGYLGAMLDYEGIDLLIEAVAPLIKAGNALKLLIVGANPNKISELTSVEYRLYQQIQHHGMENQIIIVNRVPSQDVAAYYHLFDICAYPRRGYEVCELVTPLKPLEAMASGKTLIGSDVRGLLDIIQPEHTGLVFENGNISQLRLTLERAINDEGLRHRLGQSAREFAKNERNWKTAAKKVDSVYRHVETKRSVSGENLENRITKHFGKPE